MLVIIIKMVVKFSQQITNKSAISGFSHHNKSAYVMLWNWVRPTVKCWYFIFSSLHLPYHFHIDSIPEQSEGMFPLHKNNIQIGWIYEEEKVFLPHNDEDENINSNHVWYIKHWWRGKNAMTIFLLLSPLCFMIFWAFFNLHDFWRYALSP